MVRLWQRSGSDVSLPAGTIVYLDHEQREELNLLKVIRVATDEEIKRKEIRYAPTREQVIALDGERWLFEKSLKRRIKSARRKSQKAQLLRQLIEEKRQLDTGTRRLIYVKPEPSSMTATQFYEHETKESLKLREFSDKNLALEAGIASLAQVVMGAAEVKFKEDAGPLRECLLFAWSDLRSPDDGVPFRAQRWLDKIACQMLYDELEESRWKLTKQWFANNVFNALLTLIGGIALAAVCYYLGIKK
ncbi:MAG: hypothetical protein ACTHM6_09215 [Tepidisphaeraceae bacterium]